MADATLESTLDPSDPGDDTLRRYRYQATYAAILAVRMVQKESEIAEIFCEHHNDISLKLQFGTLYSNPGEDPRAGRSPVQVQ